MAPTGPGKRKRGDRSFSGDSRDDGQRPSPHRPGNLNMAQPPNYGRDFSDGRGRGRGRGGRGGRGGYGSRQPSDAPPVVQQQAAMKSPEPAESTMTNGNNLDTPMPDPTPPEAEPEVDGEPYESNAYAYEFITNETITTWGESGKEEFLHRAQRALKEQDETSIASMAQELVHSALALRLPPTEAGEIIKALAESENVTEDEPISIKTAVLDFIAVSADIEHMPSAAAPSLRRLLIHSGIDADILRRELDGSLLVKIGLVRDTFARMGIRKATNVLYKQSNYNLMREESEGFAKLMTELFTTTSNEPPTAEIVEDAVEKVKAMIGSFDLDVGRTLDVILDVFGAVLIKQFRFFVKFLRASPWWPRDSKPSKCDTITGLPLWANRGNAGWTFSDEQKEVVAQYSTTRDATFWTRAKNVGLQAFFELGRTRAPDELIESANTEHSDKISDDDKALFDWIKETGTLPPAGNRDAAQLLGFKLRFYSSSAARDENDTLPDNLIHLSALLIKIGFISLKDLYPHLWRSDEDMEQLREQKMKDKADRERDARPGAGAKNALLMAGALADDTVQPPRDTSRLRESNTRAGTPLTETAAAKTTSTSAVPESADQKVALLKSLLAIGALPEALFILGRFPWILELYPEMPEYINRILHHSLSRVYASIQPLSSRSSLQLLRPSAETDVPGLPKGQVRLIETPVPKVLKWALLDRSDHSDGQDYRFYWEEWSDNVPVCQDIGDVFTLCQTLLNLVGVRIGQDAELLVKFARIGKYSLKIDDSEKNRSSWLDLSKRFLLPALSFTKSNAGVVNEVYELISTYPISTRYLMYLEWSAGRTSRLPEMKTAVEQARAETRDVLKKISKTNVKPMARQLAKVAYANPHVVITTAMSQIEAYDGIAEVFIEGVRYFTDLGYDVLTWAMISSMAREGRSRTQESGLFTSRWLIALASFGGKICRRYSMMKPGPILKYVAEQLGNGNLTDLIMLEQIVLNMGGITTDTNYNDAQLQAMGGGELLQSQTILQLLDRRHDAKATSTRLMRELRGTGLTGKLLISMAQQRQACVFDKENSGAPLKLLGNIFDEIHRIMIQYLDLLRTNLRVEDFRAIIPDVAQLLFEYHICPEIAFTIARPAIRSSIIEFDKDEAERKKEEVATPKDLSNDDEEMEDLINGASEEDGEATETPDVTEGATPTPAALSNAMLDQLDSEVEAAEEKEQAIPEIWHPILKGIMDTIRSKLPQEVVDLVGVGFFTTFWQLSLYDIAVASDAYNDEIKRLTARVKALIADRSNIGAAATREKDKQKKELKDLIDGLMSENRQHIKASNILKKRLEVEKKQWFVGKARINIQKLNEALMENCFFPRLLCSPIDAYFCFKFVKYLHSSGTPNFRTLSFYELMFKSDRLASLAFACTSNEADNFGRFLNEVLRDLSRWHQSKTVYEKEAWGSSKDLPGFAMSVSSAGKVMKLLNYEDFRRVLFLWHQKLHTALTTCLSSTEYMHIRNAISILRAVSKHFPAVVFHGTTLRKSIEALADSDKEDLKLSSKAILSELNKREKAWMIPQAFRKGKEMEKPSEDGTKKAATPQPADQLNAEAPEFTPSQPAPDATEKKSTEIVDPKDVVMTDVSTAEPSEQAMKQETVVKPENQSVADVKKETTPAPSSANTDANPEKAVNGDDKGNSTPKGPASTTETRRGDLPRRPSPPRSVRPSPSLPSRLDPADRRSTRRDDAHVPLRPPFAAEPGRHVSDTRPLESLRHGRPDDRSRDPYYDRPGPYPPRGHERDERGPPVRSDYGRGHEREHNPRHPSDYSSARPEGRDSGTHGGYDARHEHPRGPPDSRYERERASEHRTSERPASSAPPVPAPQASVSVNPERAALIGADANPPRDMTIKGQAQERATRGSRPTSPKPSEDRRPPPRLERPDESRYDRRVDPNHQPLGTNVPPSGQRPTRQDRSGPFGGDSRSSHRTPVDMQHGRLEQDPAPAPPPTSFAPDEAPLGPRGRSTALGPRGRGEPIAPINTSTMPSANNIPTGPSRLHGRTSSYQESPASVVPSSPSVPAPDTTGVHPSRLNLVASPTQEAPPRFQPQQPQSAVGSSPPMGPRSAAPANAPTGPSPTTRGPPSGPGMGTDSSARGGRNGRHPLTAVNNHLEQAGRGTNIRGRGTRQNSQSGPITPNMPPPSPAQAFGQGFPSAQQPESRRPDLSASGPNNNGSSLVPNGPALQTQATPNDRFLPPRPAPNDRRSDINDERSRTEGRPSSRPSSRGPGPERNGERDRRPEDGNRGASGGYHDEPRRSGRSRESEFPTRPDVSNIRGGYGTRGGYVSDRGGYGGSDRGGYGPGRGDPRGQKHGRDGDVNPYPSSGGPGGRGSMRNASENKRVRRGG